MPALPLPDENPAFVVYTDAATSKTVYSLWLGGMVRLADSVEGPFVPVASYPGGNPAPVFHDGAFYMTNQATLEIFTTPAITPGAVWTLYANISHDALPPTTPPGQYHVEDASARAQAPSGTRAPWRARVQAQRCLGRIHAHAAPPLTARAACSLASCPSSLPQPFLWIDKRGHWHIINHAYSNVEFENCGASAVSAHFFSADGKNWSFSPQPYGHTVRARHRRPALVACPLTLTRDSSSRCATTTEASTRT